jgi:hypothetical protein
MQEDLLDIDISLLLKSKNTVKDIENLRNIDLG